MCHVRVADRGRSEHLSLFVGDGDQVRIELPAYTLELTSDGRDEIAPTRTGTVSLEGDRC